jgi:hypothetical protein
MRRPNDDRQLGGRDLNRDAFNLCRLVIYRANEHWLA